MKILLSIKPEYAEKILDGEKQFEFRKTIFKNKSVKTVVIYATKPVGKVVGEFDIEEVISEEPHTLWLLTSEFSGITKSFFNEYFKGKSTAHAIKVRTARRYKIPLNLEDILNTKFAPQSFCYLN